ncbi:MAG: DUF547 domain-containing protein [Myxococcota bacterium]|nr:DUF547 domain-containing protein [Myxococcota bacterium]
MSLGCTDKVHVQTQVSGDPSAPWQAVLEQVTTEQGVDYPLLARNLPTLENFLAWVAGHGPETDLMKESQEDKRLSFLLNAYTAAVLYGTLRLGPPHSLQDVELGLLHRGVEGFHTGQRFRIDGEWVSLAVLRDELLLGRFQEPLIHVALPLSSQGGPPVRWWPEKRTQQSLERAMVDFLDSDRGMLRDGDDWRVSEWVLWHARDFVEWSEARDLCDWLGNHVTGERGAWVDELEGCDLPSFAFSWAMDQAPADVPPEEPGPSKAVDP